MKYSTALRFVNRIPASVGADFNLEAMREFLDKSGIVFQGIPILQIAGTNGKGSVAASAASILREAGYRTGLYTSPHVLDLRERIRVNGRKIPRKAFSLHVSRLKPLFRCMRKKPTHFEAVTMLALDYFAARRVEALVLEVGLGGRLDATNALDADVAVITNVTAEHTQWLGKTVEKIAREKAGIFKRGSIVLTAATGTALNVIRARAKKLGCPVHSIKARNVKATEAGTTFSLRATPPLSNLFTPLVGSHQAINAALAVAAVQSLQKNGLAVPAAAIRRGLKKVSWPARLQRVHGKPLVLVDAAHNPAGCEVLAESLKIFPHEKRVLVFGCFADKDAKKMLAILEAVFTDCLFTTVDNPRRLSAKNILSRARGLGLAPRILEKPAEAFREAVSLAGPSGLVVVAGSISLAEDAFRHFRISVP